MNILLIGNKFFGYTDRVCTQMKKHHNVGLLYTYSATYQDRIWKNLGLYKDNSMTYYIDQLNLIFERIDYFDVVFIFGGGVSTEFVHYLKKKYNLARFIIYLSADIRNYGFTKDYLSQFDKVMTYSMNDSREFNLIYKSWFFSDEEYNDKKYDIAFIGSIHKSRLNILELIKKDISFSRFFYIYTDRLSYIKTIWSWQHMSRDIYFESLPYNDYIRILSESRAILDIPTDGQTNITTRPIEALATNTKVITTNKYIRNYDFYDDDNIYIIDKENVNLSNLKDWISKPYSVVDTQILNRYNLKNWINEVLS